jgi:hypothetical protein
VGLTFTECRLRPSQADGVDTRVLETLVWRYRPGFVTMSIWRSPEAARARNERAGSMMPAHPGGDERQVAEEQELIPAQARTLFAPP